MISDAERKLMRHALGLEMAERPYRNRYITRGPHAEWDALVARGLAANPPIDTKTDQRLYAVTDEGIATLGIALMPDDLEPNERYTACDTTSTPRRHIRGSQMSMFANRSDAVRADRLYALGHRCFWKEVSDPFGLRPRMQHCDVCRATVPMAEPGRSRETQGDNDPKQVTHPEDV